MSTVVNETKTQYNGMRYAAVRLLDSPYHMDMEYTYRIPDLSSGFIKVGSVVTVPYGNGNRRVKGVVTRLSSRCDYDPSRLKRIDLQTTDGAYIDKERLELCSFIRKRYLCTFGDAAKLMLPPGALGKSRICYTITDLGEDADLDCMDIVSREIMVYMRREKIAALDTLKITFPRMDLARGLDALVESKYIDDCTELCDFPQSYEKVYTATVSRERLQDIIAGKDEQYSVRSAHQMDIFRYFLGNDEYVPEHIPKDERISSSVLNRLCEKGLLSMSRRHVYKDLKLINSYPVYKSRKIVLNECQQAAYDKLSSLYEQDTSAAALLYGITGSGKTSVMLSMIDRVVADKKQVIVLIPEISLTPQTISLFASRYGEKVAIVHSGLSMGERSDAYNRIKSGEVSVVIGTRSAVFSPVSNLGMIIIDEEHEHTYKSEMTPRYHAREIAKFRCVYANALLVMASATPDVESYYNAQIGKYHLVTLDQRYGDAVLPDVEVVDMRKQYGESGASPLSSTLINALKQTLDSGNQAIIFINRRGFNNYVVCAECGEAQRCPHCDVSLTYHTRKNDYSQGTLKCHMCGYTTSEKFKCSECGSEKMIRFGSGTQKIEKEITDIFPSASVIRMDMDAIDNKNAYFEKLNAFKRHEADILLGTSMITKGHDFPEVTLVGVLMADASLHLDDYRAGERTFSMITQVVGRAGRGSKKGRAIVQVMQPENEMIRLACKQDYPVFYESEIKYRSAANFPPMCDIAVFELSSEKENYLLEYANLVRKKIDALSRTEFSGMPIMVYGPCEAPIYKADNKYRVRIIIKCKLNDQSRRLFDMILAEHSKMSLPLKPSMALNISPVSL